MTQAFVIVGASHASVQAIDTLRREGHPGPIVLVGDEPHLPYNRPPLSKKFLSGELERERLLLRSPQFYEQAHVDTRLGVTGHGHRPRRDGDCGSSDGDELTYDKLLLCVGSRPRLLEAPGHDLARHPLPAHDRGRRGHPRRSQRTRGGWSSSAPATSASRPRRSARHLGLDVTVLEMADRPLNRVVAPQLSEFYAAQARTRGRAHPLQHVGDRVRGRRPRARSRLRRAGLPGRHRDRRRRHPAGREPGGRRPASAATTVSGWTSSARPRTRTSGRRATAPTIRASGTAGACGSSRWTTRSSRAASQPPNMCGGAGAARARAVVLVRPVRRQAADRGPVAGL